MDEYEKEIIRFSKALRDQMLDKYRKGKIEHGGEPFNIDPQKEINDEVLDILNYHLISKVNSVKKFPLAREENKTE